MSIPAVSPLNDSPLSGGFSGWRAFRLLLAACAAFFLFASLPYGHAAPSFEQQF